MPTTEFFLIGGMILVGMIFLLIAYSYLSGEAAEAKRLQVKAEADEITSLIYRISKDPAPYLRYCQFVKLSNITIKNNMLKYERIGHEFVTLLPPNTSDVELIEATEICILKRDGKITLVGEKPICEIDGICMLEECKEYCEDCGPPPTSVCVGDGHCNLDIGENCENSINDCSCSRFGPNYICCLDDPQKNEYGCVGETRQNLDKGKECFCHNQCKAGLKCNPTTEDFTAYEKACCEEGKSWNGNECVVMEAFDIFIVPVQISDQDRYLSVVLTFKDHFLSVSPFRECKNRDSLVKFWIINISDCPTEAGTRCFNHCGDCINIGRRCAKRMESVLQVSYDKFQVITTGGGWRGGCACGIPCDGASNSLVPCSSILCIPSHEIGHNLGLGHVDCGVPCHACIHWSLNCADCGHPDRARFIMDYCSPMERYGPAAYDGLKTHFSGSPPNAAGLGKWMKECVR